jgi:parallel beta-helix repeat protein
VVVESLNAPGRRSVAASSRPWWRTIGALVAACLTVSVLVVDASPSADAATVWHVSTRGSDSASGSSSSPLRSIGEAVDRASSGDAIEIRGGVYRESVQVYRKALDIRSAPGERAILDGSVPVSGWERGSLGWFVDGWTTQFHADFGAMVLPGYRTAGYPDQVFVGGEPLFQAAGGDAWGPGHFFHATGADRMWIADDPAGRTVDISNRSWGIYFNEAHGSSLTNVTVRRYATERRHIAAIRAYADDLTFDGVVAEDNAAIGISVIGDDVTIANGRASDNGYIGIHADSATDLVIDAMSVVGNNRAGFDPFHSAAGIKTTRSANVTVRHSDVSWNHGPGIWTDVSSAGAVIVGNLAESNHRSGIEVELTDGAVIAANTALRNGEAGIWVLESQQVDVWNNAAFDNAWQIKVEEGPRRDVDRVTIRNNILGSSRATGAALLDVNDWTENRSAAQMRVTADHNVYWRPSTSSTPVSRWGRWPSSLAVNTSLGAHRSNTGQGERSVALAGDDRFPVRAAKCRDYRGVETLAAGAPLPPVIAGVVDLLAGLVSVPGPTAVAPRLRYDWPLDARVDPGPAGGLVGANGMRHAVRVGPVDVLPNCA